MVFRLCVFFSNFNKPGGRIFCGDGIVQFGKRDLTFIREMREGSEDVLGSTHQHQFLGL